MMKLLRCEIKNFRSIRQLTISFDNQFQTLVGYNEAGKSNILRALSLLNPTVEFSPDDIRDVRYSEDPIEDSYVRFIFSEDKKVYAGYCKEVASKFKKRSTRLAIVSKNPDEERELDEFLYLRNECLYEVNIKEGTRKYQYWTLSAYKQYSFNEGWKQVSAQWPGRSDFPGENFSFFNINDYPQYADTSGVEDADVDAVNDLIGAKLIEALKLDLTKCITWRYSEANILPGKISIKAFVADPSSCVPLKNIFSLAGYDDIPKTIADAQGKDKGMRNLLRRLSAKATEHLHAVWPDYKKISISLEENGVHIEAGISDEFNFYSFERRSDGFKRFITFLLMLSVGAKTEKIKDTLILVDEPDVCLHPSGIRFLRKELEKISQNNTVVISTHSIFMVDQERVQRNLIVKKENEETLICSGDACSVLDEEVVYKALGFSYYEILRAKNVIFEGWSDKFVFSKWLASTHSGVSKKEWSEIGLLYALGVKDIARVAALLDGLDREYIIISDADSPALERQRQFEGKGVWATFLDLGIEGKETIEDFLDEAHVNAVIAKVVKDEQKSFEDIEVPSSLSFNKKIEMLSAKSHIDKKRLSNLVKNKLYDGLTGKHIDLAVLVSKIDLENMGIRK